MKSFKEVKGKRFFGGFIFCELADVANALWPKLATSFIERCYHGQRQYVANPLLRSLLTASPENIRASAVL